MSVYFHFPVNDPADLALIDEGLAEQERYAVEMIQCITTQATAAQCKEAAARLVAISVLRFRIRVALNKYEGPAS